MLALFPGWKERLLNQRVIKKESTLYEQPFNEEEHNKLETKQRELNARVISLQQEFSSIKTMIEN